jgi:hypothetical protein
MTQEPQFKIGLKKDAGQTQQKPRLIDCDTTISPEAGVECSGQALGFLGGHGDQLEIIQIVIVTRRLEAEIVEHLFRLLPVGGRLEQTAQSGLHGLQIQAQQTDVLSRSVGATTSQNMVESHWLLGDGPRSRHSNNIPKN